MIPSKIMKEYNEWLFNLVCSDRYSQQISYTKVLTRLRTTEFTWSIPMDENRAEDGISLRYRFALTHGYRDVADLILDYLEGPCSVLEMMVALAIRCEEDIMDDPNIGDRVSQWFWGMMINLGIGSMNDDLFNEKIVDDAINRFIYREYEPNGRGGLFTVIHCDHDLRNVEIWHQLLWYLNSIT